MRKKNLRKLLNKEGMSFVEVLVAMMVLAFAAAPMLTCLISSTKFNQQAKVKQRAVTACQSILEGLKAYGLEESLDQIDNAALLDALPNASGVSYSKTNTGADAEYILRISGLAYETKSYDAKVTIKPASSSTAVGDGAIYDGKKTISSIDDLNPYVDAIFKDNIDTNTNARDSILAAVANEYNVSGGTGSLNPSTLTTAQVSSVKLGKKTKVLIEGPSNARKVSVVTSYDCDVQNMPVGGSTWTASIPDAFFNTANLIFDNTLTGCNLQDIYLFYYPAYTGLTAGDMPFASETITIENRTSETFDVYLFKQIDPGISTSNLALLQLNYHPNINVVTNPGLVNIYGNITKVFKDNEGKALDDSTASYSYNGANRSSGSANYKIYMSETDKLIADAINAGTDTENSVYLYDVTIDIFDSGSVSGDVLASMKGTINR